MREEDDKRKHVLQVLVAVSSVWVASHLHWLPRVASHVAPVTHFSLLPSQLCSTFSTATSQLNQRHMSAWPQLNEISPDQSHAWQAQNKKNDVGEDESLQTHV